MLHFPNMNILKCSLSKLPPHITYHSYPLYQDHLQPQHVVATCVTATILNLSETFQGISVIICLCKKKSFGFHQDDIIYCFWGLCFGYCIFTYLFPDLSFYCSCIPVCCVIEVWRTSTLSVQILPYFLKDKDIVSEKLISLPSLFIFQMKWSSWHRIEINWS